MAKKKTEEKKTCPITRTEFTNNAPKGSAVMVKVQEEIGLVLKDRFSSGGFGYYGGGKISIKVGDEVVRCQVSMNIVVVDSKHAEDGTEAAETEAVAAAS